LLVHVGLAGMFDLGFAAFYAIGAYTCAFLASPFQHSFAVPGGHSIAGVLAALVGSLICIPVLKLRGDYLGM
jgi:branched-chain amino acid transport system permease protein